MTITTPRLRQVLKNRISRFGIGRMAIHSGILESLINDVEQLQQANERLSTLGANVGAEMSRLRERREIDAERMEALEMEHKRLCSFVKSVIRYAGNAGDDYLADAARAALNVGAEVGAEANLMNIPADTSKTYGPL